MQLLPMQNNGWKEKKATRSEEKAIAYRAFNLFHLFSHSFMRDQLMCNFHHDNNNNSTRDDHVLGSVLHSSRREYDFILILLLPWTRD